MNNGNRNDFVPASGIMAAQKDSGMDRAWEMHTQWSPYADSRGGRPFIPFARLWRATSG